MTSKIYLIAIILAVVCTLVPAYALSGPNVSLGSNPLQSWSKRITNTNNGWSTFEAFSADFIITDLTLSANNDCHLSLSDQNTSLASPHFLSAYSGYNSPYISNFSSGIRIPAGTTVYIYTTASSVCHYTITGYYSH